MANDLDSSTLIQLRDLVRVEERTNATLLYLGDQELFRWAGCGNQHANKLMRTLRAAFDRMSENGANHGG